ncbi:MAG: hypothetical protein RR452_08025 [Clostridia bacterium]
MRAIKVAGISLRVHPAFLVMLLLGALLGGTAQTAALALSLALHEAGHLLMARALKIAVVEVELMPFGAAMRLENAWGLRAGQMTLVALAGPLVNLLVIMGTLALVRAGHASGMAAMALIQANGLLCLFNLLPALPLDGGRVLAGLIGMRLGQARAANIGVWIGRVLAGLMLAATLLGTLLLGKINLTVLLCAVFILASGGRERLAAGSAGLMSMMNRRHEMEEEGALPIRWLAASGQTPLHNVIARFRPRELHRIAVYDEALRLSGVLEEPIVLKAALDDANQPLVALVK